MRGAGLALHGAAVRTSRHASDRCKPFRHPHLVLARRPFGYLVECAETLALQLSEALGERVQPTDVLIDAPPPDREIEFDVEIYFPKEDVYRPLHTVSPVVDALARTQFDDYVKRVRVFAHPRIAARIADSGAFSACLATAISETADSR